jgi:hypothetical protein
MKYFYDTEFIEDGKTIELLSIGIVSEDGRKLYCESNEADLSKADDWVKKNVISTLWHKQKDKSQYNEWTKANTGGFCSRRDIAYKIKKFCDISSYGKPEFWAYYADYDHVALCQLFGKMIDLPKDWPMYTNDIKQLCVSMGNPRLPDQSTTEHNALNDAEWCKEAYLWLVNNRFVINKYSEFLNK